MRRKLFICTLIMMIFILGINCTAYSRGFYINYSDANKTGDLYKYLKTRISRASSFTGDNLSEIANYVEYAAKKEAYMEANASDNSFSVNGAAIKEKFDKGKSTMDSYKNLLTSNGISLNREVYTEVDVFINGFDISSFAKITIDYDNLQKMVGIDRVKFIYGKNNEYISLSGEDMKTIAETQKFYGAEVKELSGRYTVRFLDALGSIVPKFYVPSKMGFPAENANSTVYAFYNNAEENWGGQYNRAEALIEVMTQYSGDYSVSEPEINITDVNELSDYEKQAIHFMVVRKYFELDKDKFMPYAKLSRYEFTEALVRMFYALDNEAQCTFPDVNDANYRYVAASQKSSIVEGFEDGTFRGETAVTVQQVIALVARTINEKNGYSYPDNIEKYIAGYDGISEWAKKELALALREGLYTPEMNLEFQSAISRKDAAVMLYRLFMIMNNTPQVSVSGMAEANLSVHETFWSVRNAVIIISAISVIDIVALIIFAVIISKKKRLI